MPREKKSQSSWQTCSTVKNLLEFWKQHQNTNQNPSKLETLISPKLAISTWRTTSGQVSSDISNWIQESQFQKPDIAAQAGNRIIPKGVSTFCNFSVHTSIISINSYSSIRLEEVIMEHSQQLVSDSSSCSTTISATNNIINNNQFNNNSRIINRNQFNSNSSTKNNSSNSSSNNCDQNARQKRLSPPKLILVPKQPIGKIMEPSSSSLPSALISFLSTEQIQSIIYYVKNKLFTCMFRLSSTGNQRRLENWFSSLSNALWRNVTFCKLL